MTSVRPTGRRVTLGVQPLEDRCTPAAVGVPWPDGSHVTLSFVPDGTPVGTMPSRLHAALDAVAAPAVWQSEILRAFRAWTDEAGIAVLEHADNGLPLGTPGAVQGDERFGDIRVAAVPLPAGTLATNTPFQWSGTTWSGDVILNTSYRVGTSGDSGAYDLFSLMLNEAGNVFGVPDSYTDPTTAAFYQYVGPRAGISVADAAAIQSLYQPGLDGFDFSAAGTLSQKSRAAAFVVEAPAAEGTETLNVIVRGTGKPTVAIYPTPGPAAPLAVEVLAAEGGMYSVELPDANPGSRYVLRVSDATAGQSEPYSVVAEFSARASSFAFDTLAAGTARSAPIEQPFVVGQNQLHQFELVSSGGPVRADVLDTEGRVVLSVQVDQAKATTTAHTYLPAGEYRLRVTALRGPTKFVLAVRMASDPIGPGYTHPPGIPPAGGWEASTGPNCLATWDKPYTF